VAKKKSQQDEALELPTQLAGLTLPPEKINGENNPEFYRQAYAAIFKMTMAQVAGGNSIPWNADAVVKMIDRMAESAGFDSKSLKDTRTDAEKVAEFFRDIREDVDNFWSQAGEKIDAVLAEKEQQMDNADKGCLRYIEDSINESHEEDEPPGSLPKAWRSRLERLRRLRDRATNPIPKWKFDGLALSNGDAKRKWFAAAWPLRLMVYCGRSNMPERITTDPAKAVYSIAKHHCKMACDVWEAREGVRYGPPLDNPKGSPTINYGEIPYEGCILVCPPGHGKTECGRFIVFSFYVENPTAQALLSHAKAEEAEKNLRYLASLFSPSETNGAGKRAFSLFGMQCEQANASSFKLKLKTKLRQPSGWAGGVKAKVSGANASLIWGDDIVDQEESKQETMRNRVYDLFNGSWMTRLRGKKNFLLITQTLWHQADAVARFIQLARDRKALFRVSIQKCGGPKSTPQFKPLWEEVYPAAKLRLFYNRLRPALYSAAYMSNPISEESKIVKFLRLYNPASDEHAAFMKTSTKYMSLDPAATRGERSDRAGVLYAGLGQVVVQTRDEHRIINRAESRLRLISADSIPATQSDLVRHVVDLCKFQTVDYVMVESRSGYHGTGDMFENYHGIDVIRLDPGNRNKEERLRAAAPAIEDANADLGLRAVVEFPGVPAKDKNGLCILMDDGTPKLDIDPRFHQLSDEILAFGVCATDDQVDALTQMVNRLAPDLGIGSGGIVTQKVLQTIREGVDPRLVALLERHEKGPPKLPAGQDLEQWTKDAWSMPKIENNSPMGFQL